MKGYIQSAKLHLNLCAKSAETNIGPLKSLSKTLSKEAVKLEGSRRCGAERLSLAESVGYQGDGPTGRKLIFSTE